MASGTFDKPRATVKNKLVSGNTDATGNLVLGADWNDRMIINVQVTNTLVCWALGVATTSSAKMLHFWDYQGNNLASTAVIARLYWLEPSDFGAVEVTS